MHGCPDVAIDVLLCGGPERGDGHDRKWQNHSQDMSTYPTPNVKIVDFESFVVDGNYCIK